MSNFHHVKQDRPNSKTWMLWKQANLLWSDAHGRLTPVLGSWRLFEANQVCHRTWPAYLCDDVLHRRQRGERYTIPLAENHGSVLDEKSFKDTPLHAVAVKIKGDSIFGWTLTHRHPTARQIDLPRTVPTECATFQAYLTALPEWERELLSNLRSSFTIHEVCEAMNGESCIVSDGASSHTKVGSRAWAISATSGQRVLNGSGPVRGGHISSYLAEAYLILASVRNIHHIMIYTMRQVPFRGQMVCDDKAII